MKLAVVLVAVGFLGCSAVDDEPLVLGGDELRDSENGESTKAPAKACATIRGPSRLLEPGDATGVNVPLGPEGIGRIIAYRDFDASGTVTLLFKDKEYRRDMTGEMRLHGKPDGVVVVRVRNETNGTVDVETERLCGAHFWCEGGGAIPPNVSPMSVSNNCFSVGKDDYDY